MHKDNRFKNHVINSGNYSIEGNLVVVSGYNLRKLYFTKFVKCVNFVIFICILCIIAYMFQVKSAVQDLTFEYKQLSQQLREENKQLNILKAELAYLKSPKRLQILALQYLKLDNIKPNQLITDGNNTGLLSASKFVAASIKQKGAKWRYKKSNSVLHHASFASKK